MLRGSVPTRQVPLLWPPWSLQQCSGWLTAATCSWQGCRKAGASASICRPGVSSSLGEDLCKDPTCTGGAVNCSSSYSPWNRSSSKRKESQKAFPAWDLAQGSGMLCGVNKNSMNVSGSSGFTFFLPELNTVFGRLIKWNRTPCYPIHKQSYSQPLSRENILQ